MTVNGMPLTLEDLVVIDLTQNVAGPFCTELLGDFGADVIKVERPGKGDDVRGFAPQWRGESAAYLAYNRNKRSIGVDLDDARGQDIVHRLGRKADIFVHTMKPGSAEARGLGYEDLSRDNPRLIYASISGFGERGPLRALPGYDPLAQAYSGIISMNGHPGAPPARVVVPLIDMGSGLWLFTGILASVIERIKTGKGAKVATSLLETGVNWTTLMMLGYQATGIAPGPAGSTSPAAAPYEAFQTADGWIQIAVGNDRMFANLCNVLDHPELPQDLRFSTNSHRVGHRANLHAILEQETRKFRSAQLMEVLREAGVPASVINTLDQVYVDEQVNALGMLPAADPSFQISEMKLVDIPVTLNGRRAALRRMPPRLGEHTDEVLRSAGYSDEEVATLKAERVIA
jgi:crotonobetainyl-CoA:carnitine CoA-transferase CaiB-like acyl-CoA transferase